METQKAEGGREEKDTNYILGTTYTTQGKGALNSQTSPLYNSSVEEKKKLVTQKLLKLKQKF